MKNSDNSDRIDQYKIFEILPEDIPVTQEGKQKMIKELKELEISGILSINSAFDDYVQLNSNLIKCDKIVADFHGGEAGICRVVEKNEYSSNSDETGRYTGKNLKALRVKKFFLTKSNNTLREIQSMTKIKHDDPNVDFVIKTEKVFFDCVNITTEEYLLYAVMPWIDDTLLSWMLKRQSKTYSDIGEHKIQRSFNEIRNVFSDILKGIQEIHDSNMIHTDLKFSNVMVEKNVNETDKEVCYHPKIIDFGYCKSTNSLSSFVGGTPGFLAPEIVRAILLGEIEPFEQTFSKKADIYSFGAMLYKIFVQETPENDITKINQNNIKDRIKQVFPHEDMASIPQLLIDDIEDILLISLQHQALDRPNAADLFNHPFFNSSITKCPKSFHQKTNEIENIEKEENNHQSEEIENNPESKNVMIEKNEQKNPDISQKENFLKLVPIIQQRWKMVLCVSLFSLLYIFALVFLSLNIFSTIERQNLPEDFSFALRDLREDIGLVTLQQARRSFERAANSSEWMYPARFLSGWMLHFGFGGPQNATRGEQLMKTYGNEALPYFERHQNDEFGFFTFFMGLVFQFLEPNSFKSKHFFEESSKKSNSYSQAMLGRHFIQNNSERNYTEAKRFLEMSAAQKNCHGEDLLGYLYQHGLGVEQDHKKASDLFKKSAERGYTWAQIRYAYNLQCGLGVPMDPFEACGLYAFAAFDNEAAKEIVDRICAKNSSFKIFEESCTYPKTIPLL